MPFFRNAKRKNAQTVYASGMKPDPRYPGHWQVFKRLGYFYSIAVMFIAFGLIFTKYVYAVGIGALITGVIILAFTANLQRYLYTLTKQYRQDATPLVNTGPDFEPSCALQSEWRRALARTGYEHAYTPWAVDVLLWRAIAIDFDRANRLNDSLIVAHGNAWSSDDAPTLTYEQRRLLDGMVADLNAMNPGD